MLNDRGPLETAHHLLTTEDPSDGIAKLWESGRLDLAVEYVALNRSKRTSSNEATAVENAVQTTQARVLEHRRHMGSARFITGNAIRGFLL